MADAAPLITRTLAFCDDTIAAAARIIAEGGVVAVASETVYGLAADATSAGAVAAIYTAKGRPSFNPLIVHVATTETAFAIGDFDASARALAEAHWPGPLTIVVPLRKDAPIASIATAGLSTIALRVPDHRAMQALLKATGKPLAAPSANASGTISPTRAEHVLRSLSGRIALIVDDGPTRGGLESTIVAVTDGEMRLLRPGPIDLDGIVQSAPTTIESPGQLAAHYAPSKPLRLDAHTARDGEWHIGFGAVGGHVSLSPSGDLVEAATHMFDALHAADANQFSTIAVAPIPGTGVGVAINDRLRRAAAGSAIEKFAA